MFRTWTWWITLFILSLTLGYFWLLGHDLSFTRVEAGSKVPAAAPALGKK